MANTLQIKRRSTGAAGAPTTLKSGELAYNAVSDVLYIGDGDDGAGNATTVESIGGKGGFVDLASAQTISGKKTHSVAPASTVDAVAGNDLVRKSQMDAVDSTKANLASPTFTGTPAAPTAAVDTNTTQLATTAFVIGQAGGTTPAMNGVAAVGTSTRFARQDHIHPTDTTRAPLASPSFTGTPTAPTATTGTNTTQLATTAFVQAAISALIDAAPAALDTLNELAAALGDDPNFAATVTSALASKLDANSTIDGGTY